MDAVTSSRTEDNDRGAAEALGLVLIAPVAIGLALLVVFLSRQVDSRAQVRTAAESAAQAAALERSPAAAEGAARDVIEAMLIDPDTCASPSAVVDVTQFAPGGLVAVTVSCSVSARGIEVIAPTDPRSPARLLTVTATATVDRYRAAERAP
jgi:Flp pilus assembly protein TadG